MIVKLLIVELGLPLSIVDRSAFSRAMCVVDPHFVMPSRRTISRSMLPSLYEQMLNDVKSRCLEANHVAASLDCWTDRRMRSFFSVTAHTIIRGHFESYVLDFSPIEEAHTAEFLLDKFNDVTKTFDIEHKLVRLVTDNASNVTCAFKDLVVPGFAEYFADINEVDDDEQEMVQLDDDPVPADETTSTAIDVEAAEQIDLESLSHRSTALRIPCFAHSIQLCVRDGLDAASRAVCNAFAKVAQIIKRSHTSTKLALPFDRLKISIPTPCVTRWNSQYAGISRLMEINMDDLNKALHECSFDHLILNASKCRCGGSCHYRTRRKSD